LGNNRHATAVLRPGGFVAAQHGRTFLAVADGLQLVARNTQLGQEILGGGGAPVAESQVVLGRAAFVAMALDGDRGIREGGEDGLQRVRVLGQRVPRIRPDIALIVVEKAIRNARLSISEGRPVAEPLAETHVFPPMVTQMIAVGEATGALDAMLGKIADFYDDEVDTAVAGLTSMLEPLLILFLGVTIGGLLVAMYLPIFQLADVVAR